MFVCGGMCIHIIGVVYVYIHITGGMSQQLINMLHAPLSFCFHRLSQVDYSVITNELDQYICLMDYSDF